MQHPDEGTIHAWLDGALPADEAARLDAHVAECAQCAAAVAEARGLIAASSRILSALDDVPGAVALGRQPSALGRDDVVEADVVPLRSPAPPVRPFRVSRRLMAAASVLLVVGVGSTLMFRGVDKGVVARTSDARYSTDTSATSPMVASAPSMEAARAPSVLSGAPAEGAAARAAAPSAVVQTAGQGRRAVTGATTAQSAPLIANAGPPRDLGADSVVAGAPAPAAPAAATAVAAADERANVVSELRKSLSVASPVPARAEPRDTAPPPPEAAPTLDEAASAATRRERAGARRIPIRRDAPPRDAATTPAAAPEARRDSVWVLRQDTINLSRADTVRPIRGDATRIIGCWEFTRGPRLGGAASNRLRLDEGGGVTTDGVRGAGTWTVSGDSLLIVVQSSADGRPVRLRLARAGDALRGTVEEGGSAVTARRVPCR